VKTLVYSLLAVTAIAAIATSLYLQHPKFGRLPEGERLTRIQQSPNYVDGEFRNLIDTPMFTSEKSFVQVLLENLSSTGAQLRPGGPVPSIKTDLHGLDPDLDVIIWLGHSSFYVQLGGKRLLIDPVFSASAAPLSLFNRAYAGSNPYTAADMPAIDALLITHDHWDHLDYPSVEAVREKVDRIVVPLGVGEYFEQWGFDQHRVFEGDWFDQTALNDIAVTLVPARHYSGRMLTRRRTLWTGYVLESADKRLLFSGDSGYGPHFAAMRERFGRFDFATLDTGQYDTRWAYIHMNPEEAARAAAELGTRILLPSHVGKFTLAKHAWDEPFTWLAEASTGQPFQLVTPQIGEPVNLSDASHLPTERWWQ
tara:strand:- start:14430 stop:15530 length:1101 start_codon:yes stop_codon:yes gene_type:complete